MKKSKVSKSGIVRVIHDSTNNALNEVLLANQGLNNNFEKYNPPFLRTYLPKHYGGRDPRKRRKGRGGA